MKKDASKLLRECAEKMNGLDSKQVIRCQRTEEISQEADLWGMPGVDTDQVEVTIRYWYMPKGEVK